jgi:antibiotic biosynthesis monooxygenase (ABM) superfamily enzyme
MSENIDNVLVITNKIRVPPSLKEDFIDWQSKLNATIAGFPGFISLEILSPTEASERAWIIVQKFSHSNWIDNWRRSERRRELMEKLREMLGDTAVNIQEEVSESFHSHRGVTEVFVTQVLPGMETPYLEWLSKIHREEARFPGFRGIYVQSPSQGQGNNWISLLQFDTQHNLDHWLRSPERNNVLKESYPLISSLESRRVASAYDAWFTPLSKQDVIPPVWKETMLVLLVLFPLVMLELKFLPHLLMKEMNASIATFIGNAISVTLIAWPMMPIAIYCLGWWLTPPAARKLQVNALGVAIVLLLYFIEIMIFWNLL